jgi:histone deacetylase complex regulatory component SIN3
MESYSKPSNQQAIEQKNALDFLDQIRREFADNGQVYNEFLNIMAEFRINQ